jgi:hypothetical protein
MQSPDLTWYLLHFISLVLPYAGAAVGITLISLTPLGRAATSWLKGHSNRGRAAELAAELERLRLEIPETQERLDFAERRLFSPPASRPTDVPSGAREEPRIPTPV